MIPALRAVNMNTGYMKKIVVCLLLLLALFFVSCRQGLKPAGRYQAGEAVHSAGRLLFLPLGVLPGSMLLDFLSRE